VKNLDECAEWLCDNEAAGANGHTAAEYAEVLLGLGQKPRNYGIWATAMRGGRLHRRICRVLTPPAKERSIMKTCLLVAVPVMLLAGNLIRVELVARAQTSETAPAAAAVAAKTDRGVPIRGNYFRPGSLVALIEMPFIQKELGIKKGSAQFDEIRKLEGTLSIEIQAQLRQELQTGLSDDDRERHLQAVTMEVDSRRDHEVKAFLSPEQTARLRQIILQDAGAEALDDPDVAKELAITKEQREKLDALSRHVEQRLHEIFTAATNENADNRLIDGRVAVLMIDRDRKANDILTPEQQDKFFALKGEPFGGQLPARYAFDSPRTPFTTRQGDLMELATREAVMKELGIAKDAPQVIALRQLSEAYSEEYEKQLQKICIITKEPICQRGTNCYSSPGRI
jgi:hypothetical protein